MADRKIQLKKYLLNKKTKFAIILKFVSNRMGVRLFPHFIRYLSYFVRKIKFTLFLCKKKNYVVMTLLFFQTYIALNYGSVVVACGFIKQ